MPRGDVGGKAVGAADVGVQPGAGPFRAFERHGIHRPEAETVLPPFLPFEIVDEAPVQVTQHRHAPFDRHGDRAQGTFSLRSPVRPNPIGLSTVRLVRREGGRLIVRGLECVSGTPLLDIKPDRCHFTPRP